MAALTGDIEENMLGLGPGELVTTYLGVSRQEEKRPIRMLDIQLTLVILAVSQFKQIIIKYTNVGLRIIDIALLLLSLYSRITTRVWC